MRNNGRGRVLRIVAIVMMSLTALFTLMGGAGTSCVALNPTGFEGRFAGIARFQWLYILFVLVTLAIGAMGVRPVVFLARGRKGAYRFSLATLVAGTVVGVVHIVASRLLRGGSMPVDMVVYATVVTLVLFLLIRLPSLWRMVVLEGEEADAETGKWAAAIALIACGLLVLTIQFIMAPTHTIGGVNYAGVWHGAMTVIGRAMIACGTISAAIAATPLRRQIQATGRQRASAT